jgi:hypothetical protein
MDIDSSEKASAKMPEVQTHFGFLLTGRSTDYHHVSAFCHFQPALFED